jgi:hypothetical protein
MLCGRLSVCGIGHVEAGDAPLLPLGRAGGGRGRTGRALTIGQVRTSLLQPMSATTSPPVEPVSRVRSRGRQLNGIVLPRVMCPRG